MALPVPLRAAEPREPFCPPQSKARPHASAKPVDDDDTVDDTLAKETALTDIACLLDQSPADESVGAMWQSSITLVVQPEILQEISKDNVEEEVLKSSISCAEMLHGRYIKVADGAWRQSDNPACVFSQR